MSKIACTKKRRPDVQTGGQDAECGSVMPKMNDTCTGDLMWCTYGMQCCKNGTWKDSCIFSHSAWCAPNDNTGKRFWHVHKRDQICDGDVGCVPGMKIKEDDPNICCDENCDCAHPKGKPERVTCYH